jgi:hypothetical protein
LCGGSLAHCDLSAVAEADQADLATEYQSCHHCGAAVIVFETASAISAAWRMTIGLDRRRGRRAWHLHQRRHCIVVHARPPQRPQYPGRLSSYDRRRRRFVRGGGRSPRDHADGIAMDRPRDQPCDISRGAGQRMGLGARQRQSRARRCSAPNRVGEEGVSEVHDLHIWAMCTNEPGLRSIWSGLAAPTTSFCITSARNSRTVSTFTMLPCRSKPTAKSTSSHRRNGCRGACSAVLGEQGAELW